MIPDRNTDKHKRNIIVNGKLWINISDCSPLFSDCLFSLLISEPICYIEQINSNRFVDITALNTNKTYDNGPRKKKGGIFVRPLYYT